jgi:ribosomal protein S18 acetylase RimI-like enzyme
MNTAPSPPAASIVSGGAELLDRISPLWHELRRHHAELAPQWRAGLLATTFAGRKAELLAKSAGGGDMLVLLAAIGGAADPVGYCVCTVTAPRDGEVDSLFVAPDHRGRGVGRVLMSAAMDWLRARSPGSIAVEVMACNAAAIRLYESYCFHARTVRMRHLNDR